MLGTSLGKVFSFGEKCQFGQLGLGDVENARNPTEISTLNGHVIERLACGDHHSLVVSQEGKVFSFGRNHRGQLGLGDLGDRHVPTGIESLAQIQIVEIAAGGGLRAAHSVCISGKNHLMS